MKDWNTYLSENGNDPEKAGQAAARDAQSAGLNLARVTTELSAAQTQARDAQSSLKAAQDSAKAAQTDVENLRGQNARARTFQRVFKPVADLLKVEDLSDEAAASDAVKKGLEGLSQNGPRAEALAGLVRDLGGDPDKLDETKVSLKTKIDRAAKADVLERSQAIRDAAESLKFDHGKLSRLSGIDALTQRDVTVEKDGKQEKTSVWGIPGKDDKGADTFTPLKDFAAPFEASLRLEGSTGGRWVAPGNTGKAPQDNPIKAALSGQHQGSDKPRVINALQPDTN